MLLSAIMLKMGVYGILRWLVPVVPLGVSAYGGLTITLAIIGLVYASCIALVQTDFKRLIAYSSLAHVGLMAAGALSMQTYAWHGVMVQMLSHGVLVFGLFYAAELLVQRVNTTSMLQMGGIRNLAPVFAVALLVIVLGNVALPLTSGFPGEFLLLAGLFHYNKALAIVGGLTVILGAVYMLKAYQKTCLGEVTVAGGQFRDLGLNEKIVLGIIAALILVIGICPSQIIEIAGPALDALLQTSGPQGAN
jgi:NADH-quinone oxidoreductase subunit M